MKLGLCVCHFKRFQYITNDLQLLSVVQHVSSEYGKNNQPKEMAALLEKQMLAKKYRGCLAGALVGDCLGAKFEFVQMSIRVRLNGIDEYFQKFRCNQITETVDYTDDTAMTIELSKSLIENHKIVFKDLAEKFTVEFFLKEKDRGYGAHVGSVFLELKKNNYEDPLKPAQDQFNGQGSYGNGAAMRVSPVALFFNGNIDAVIQAAKDSGLITHSNPKGYNGGILQCLAVHQALISNPAISLDKDKFIDELIQQMLRLESDKHHPEGQDYCKQLIELKKLMSQEASPQISDVVRKLGHGVAALKSVPTAIFVFLYCQTSINDIQVENQFERTIQYAISLGGDTDTIASMAGAITGAYLGIDAIPEYLVKPCECQEEILTLADQLYEASQKHD